MYLKTSPVFICDSKTSFPKHSRLFRNFEELNFLNLHPYDII
jgi:hypothetical protein